MGDAGKARGQRQRVCFRFSRATELLRKPYGRVAVENPLGGQSRAPEVAGIIAAEFPDGMQI